MNFLRWLLSFFAPSPASAGPRETPADVADRLDRCADRFAHAADREAELDARDAAKDARKAPNLAAAQKVEQDFYRSRGLRPDGRPFKPVVGADGSTPFVRYSNTVRRGGTLGWRYNNPGYIRCSDRATYWGAVGCDGEYAIFPNEAAGYSALRQWHREENPNMPIDLAVSETLPPAQAAETLDYLQAAGVNLAATDLPDAFGGGGWDDAKAGDVLDVSPAAESGSAPSPQPWDRVVSEDAVTVTDNS